MGDGVEAGSGRFIQLRCSEWHLQDMRMNLKPFLLNEDTVAVDLILIIARLAMRRKQQKTIGPSC